MRACVGLAKLDVQGEEQSLEARKTTPRVRAGEVGGGGGGEGH